MIHELLKYPQMFCIFPFDTENVFPLQTHRFATYWDKMDWIPVRQTYVLVRGMHSLYQKEKRRTLEGTIRIVTTVSMGAHQQEAGMKSTAGTCSQAFWCRIAHPKLHLTWTSVTIMKAKCQLQSCIFFICVKILICVSLSSLLCLSNNCALL